MTEMIKNIYSTLSLPFFPSVEDFATIEQQIKTKNLSELNQPFYLKQLQDKKRLREIIGEAYILRYGALENRLMTLSKKGREKVTQHQLRSLIQDYSINESELNQVLASLNILSTNRTVEKKDQITTQKQYLESHIYFRKREIQGYSRLSSSFKIIESDVKDGGLSFKTQDFYDFLSYSNFITPVKSDVTYTSSSSLAELVERAREIQTAYDYKTTGEGKSIKTLSQNLLNFVFKDIQSKNEYDELLVELKKFDVVNQIMMNIKKYSDRTQQESPSYLKALRTIYKKEQASRILSALALVYGGVVLLQNGKMTENEYLICRCGKNNLKQPGKKNCTNCGRNLYLKCLACGSEYLSSQNKCPKDGFNFTNYLNASDKLYELSLGVEVVTLTIAEELCEEASSLCPNHPDLVTAKERIAAAYRIVGSEHRQKETAGFLIEAQTIYQRKKRQFPWYSDQSFDDSMRIKRTKADRLFSKANSQHTKEQILAYCLQVYKICKDYPGLEMLKNKYTDLSFEVLELDFIDLKDVKGTAKVINKVLNIRLENIKEIISHNKGVELAVFVSTNGLLKDAKRSKPTRINKIESTIVLNEIEIEEKEYLISVYLCHHLNDRMDYSSEHIQIIYNNQAPIILEYTFKKKFFSPGKVEFIVSSNRENCVLPEIIVLKGEGGLPVNSPAEDKFEERVYCRYPREKLIGTTLRHLIILEEKNLFLKALLGCDTVGKDKYILKEAKGINFKVS